MLQEQGAQSLALTAVAQAAGNLWRNRVQTLASNRYR